MKKSDKIFNEMYVACFMDSVNYDVLSLSGKMIGILLRRVFKEMNTVSDLYGKHYISRETHDTQIKVYNRMISLLSGLK